MRNKKVALVVVAAVAGGLWMLQRGKGEAEEDGAPRAMLASVERRGLEVVVEAAGQVEPTRMVEVKSNASGMVQRVYVETGSRVEEGTLLAEIDPRDVQNALDQALADTEAARVRLSTANAHRTRMESLVESGVVTRQEYETATASAASARAEFVRATTNLRLARERRQDVTIRAPITGTIIEKLVEPGMIIASATMNVGGGTTLFQMADLSAMQVRARVDETDIGQVQPGQGARVSVDAFPGRSFAGEVLKIEPQAVVEQNVTMFPVLIGLDNQRGLLRPGMNAEVTIAIADRPEAIVVPNNAVVSMRQARTAAATLGIPEDLVRSALRPPSPDGAPPSSGDDDGCEQLRAKVMAAGGPMGLPEPDRARLRECFRPPGGKGRMGGGRPGLGDGDGSKPRPAMVFVDGDAGLQPRRVMLGLSDWEHTEVVTGLAPGEKVVLISVAQMQQRQQQMTDRVRQRTGGMFGGGRR